MSKVLVNESSLTGIADAIRGKNGSTDTYKPSEMAAAITAISGGGGGYDIPEEAFVLSGDCSHRFSKGGWDWFIEKYGNKITTKDITSCLYMFNDCKLTQIPFDINLNSSEEINLAYMFSSSKLTTLPTINNNNNSTIGTMNSFLS